MKSIVASFIFCTALLQISAAGEPLIPAPLNSLLVKIQPGMTTNQVLSVLSSAYPRVTVHMGDWSGSSGYLSTG